MSGPHFLVVDLEATCDAADRLPRDEREIIEIGAVFVDGTTFETQDTFQCFVKPTHHPVLTPFCVSLTHIDQRDVDTAQPLPAAMVAFAQFVQQRSALFCSWGAFDAQQLATECARHGIVSPLGAKHLDVRQAYNDLFETQRPYGLRRALARLGSRFEGTPHRALDDALNTAKLLPYATGAAPLPRPPGGWSKRGYKIC